jgi:hypothetical protein
VNALAARQKSLQAVDASRRHKRYSERATSPPRLPYVFDHRINALDARSRPHGPTSKPFSRSRPAPYMIRLEAEVKQITHAI